MYTGNNYDNFNNGKLILMLQVRQLSFISVILFFVNNLIPMQFPIKRVWPVQASDMLLGDHVCEKSDAVKWIDCP